MARDQDLLLHLGARISQQYLEEEPVELRFRERIGAFVLHGVLGREHQEWIGSARVSPSVVTLRSCIASRSALWVFAGRG